MTEDNLKTYQFYTDQVGFSEVDTKGDKEYYITGYISTKDKDLVNDVVSDKALDGMLRQIQSKNIKLDVDHEIWSKENLDILPIGRITEARRDGRGIFIKATLNRNHAKFKEVWGSIKDKYLDAFSIAYKAVDFTYKTMEGVKTRILNGIELLNVAITGNPVNPACTMTSVFTKSITENPEVPKMAEEETKSEEQPVEEQPKEVVEEKEAVEEKEEAPEELAEVKSLKETIESKDAELKSLNETHVAEVKSLKEANEKLQEEFKSLQAKLDNPIMKAAQKSIEVAAEHSEKVKSPLDAI